MKCHLTATSLPHGVPAFCIIIFTQKQEDRQHQHCLRACWKQKILETPEPLNQESTFSQGPQEIHSYARWRLKCTLLYHVTHGSVLYTIYWVKKGQKTCILWLAWLASCLKGSWHKLCIAEVLIVECRLAKTDFSLLRSTTGTHIHAAFAMERKTQWSWMATAKITGEENRHWLVVRWQRGSYTIRELSVSLWGLPGWLLRLLSCPSHFLWCTQQTSLIEGGQETEHLYFL